ncbi:MAG: hypothetical protein JSW71_23120, partial [Gemmatimonadota bacterium]
MARHCKSRFWAALFVATVSTGARAQITSNEGDGVLNAPYRGTVTSLRELCQDIPYGEVKTHCEPLYSDENHMTSNYVEVWAEGDWDRSVLRLYEGVDASGDEVDLTGTHSGNRRTVYRDGSDFKRFSWKAIGTKNFTPQQFTIKFYYQLNWSQWVTVTRDVRIVPLTGSFFDLPGEGEAFHYGTPILDVSVGAVRLIVPVGRTAEMVGACFEDKDAQLGPSSMVTMDVLLPGAAETVYIQNISQFRLGWDYGKASWGTPWPGHLVGYMNSGDTWAPDATFYNSLSDPHTQPLRRYDRIQPYWLNDYHPATQQLVYDNEWDNRVTEIHDGAAPQNKITLHRTAGAVSRVTTSDGRGWTIESDPEHGWITSVTPDSGKGKRSYSYNSAGRVTSVKNAAGQVMYQFIYADDANGDPTVLTEEWRHVDGAPQKVVEHNEISATQLQRVEYIGDGNYRQFDFLYDSDLPNRLTTIRAYHEVNAGGGAHDTDFEHDVNDPDGTVAITRVTLPDDTWLEYEYDSPDSASVNFGFRTRVTHKGVLDGSLVTHDIEYEF